MAFVIKEVKAFSRNEVRESVAVEGLKVEYDATQSWIKAGKPIQGDLETFCKEYLQDKHKSIPGVGCFIVFDNGVASTRTNPVKVENVVTEGTRKYGTVIQGVNAETGEILFECDGTKDEAKAMAKEFILEKGFKGTINARYIKIVKEGTPLAFTAMYSPSKNTKVGKYFVFGITR